MRRILGLLMILLASLCLPVNVQGDYFAAREQARASVQSAWIYGGAIVLAGAGIGAGLYLGLRARNRDQ